MISSRGSFIDAQKAALTASYRYSLLMMLMYSCDASTMNSNRFKRFSFSAAAEKGSSRWYPAATMITATATATGEGSNPGPRMAPVRYRPKTTEKTIAPTRIRATDTRSWSWGSRERWYRLTTHRNVKSTLYTIWTTKDARLMGAPADLSGGKIQRSAFAAIGTANSAKTRFRQKPLKPSPRERTNSRGRIKE